MSEKKFERDTAEEYRVAAERDLRRRLDELALSLGVPQSDGEKGSGVCSEAAATTAAVTRDTAAGAGAKIDVARTLSAETAERILRTLGADRRKAKTLARVLDFRADDDALRALAQAVGYAADASRADKAGGIHGGHRRRLRESARRDGDLDAFSDIEILETLLSFVIPQRNTNPLAHRLLDRFGSLLGVFRAERAALYEVSGMTRAAAELFGVLTVVCLWNGAPQMRIAGHADAAAFFGSVYLGGAHDGTRVAYLDGGFGLIAVEKLAGLADPKPIIGSVCRYSARYVIVSRREEGLFPVRFESAESVARLAETLRSVDARLLDCFVFTDCGYYALSGAPAVRGMPEYVFVPAYASAHAPELAHTLLRDG